jgi:predicted nucleic acid-binding protein
MARYRDAPMSLADATLVRLAELNDSSQVVRLDAGFRKPYLKWALHESQNRAPE